MAATLYKVLLDSTDEGCGEVVVVLHIPRVRQILKGALCQAFLEAKQHICQYLSVSIPSGRPQGDGLPIWHHFPVTQDNMFGSRLEKQGCSNGLARSDFWFFTTPMCSVRSRSASGSGGGTVQ